MTLWAHPATTAAAAAATAATAATPVSARLSHLDRRSQALAKLQRQQPTRWLVSRDYAAKDAPKPAGTAAASHASPPNRTVEIPATHRLSFGSQSICRLTIPAASVAHMANLVEIRLPNNKLSQLPNALFLLTQLEILNLESNSLSQDSAADWMWRKLVHLRVLFLADNAFTELPRAIARLPRLFYLDVSENSGLQSLPIELLTSPSLGTLAANGCSALSSEMAAPGSSGDLRVPSLKSLCLRDIQRVSSLANKDGASREPTESSGDSVVVTRHMKNAIEEMRRNPTDFFVAELVLSALDSVNKLPLCSICDRPVLASPAFGHLRLLEGWDMPFSWICCTAACRDAADTQTVHSQLSHR
ncbi:hypothetical protein GGI07_005274 [Coemansia sp. Benny D115]|nr:hypothetical protein GGI07_005274 [Coemansia sp. Benny D115]